MIKVQGDDLWLYQNLLVSAVPSLTPCSWKIKFSNQNQIAIGKWPDSSEKWKHTSKMPKYSARDTVPFPSLSTWILSWFELLLWLSLKNIKKKYMLVASIKHEKSTKNVKHAKCVKKKLTKEHNTNISEQMYKLIF